MVARSRLAVFACPMRHRFGSELDRVLPFPCYPAWPEISDPYTFYTLSTLNSFSAINRAFYWVRHSFWDSSEELTLREHIHNIAPDLEEEIIQLNLQTLDEINITIGPQKLYQSLSRGVARAAAMEGSANPEWEAFAILHEMGHETSFTLMRPIIRKINKLTCDMFDVLRRASISKCTNFWDEFCAANNELTKSLDKDFAIEELRANLFALFYLDPDIRANIMPYLRDVMTNEGTLTLFDTLRDATNENWDDAFKLSLNAECFENPGQVLLYLLSGGKLGIPELMFKNAGWVIDLSSSKGRKVEIEYSY